MSYGEQMILLILGYCCLFNAVIMSTFLAVRAWVNPNWNNEMSWNINRNIALYAIAAAICLK